MSVAIGALAVVPAAAAGGAVVVAAVVAATGRPDRRVWPARLAVAAGAVSLAATGRMAVAPPDYGDAAGWAGIGECGALLALVVAATRWAPRRAAAAGVGVAGLAVAVCVLRFLPSDSLLDAVGACALWAGGPAVAVVIGGYPRLAEARRRDSVARERRSQRLALARDLHDFVAHDVSGIVALAQAARFVAGTDPARALDALARVEAAGLRALDTMDRTVAMLGDLAGPPGAAPGLGDLPDLLRRFDGPARVESDVAAPEGVPAEVGTTAYRLVREALTNVRRHAPAATAVRVVVARTQDALAVTVTNDATPGGARTPGNGTGLADLRHRAHLLGGTLQAGPSGDGWRVAAVLPLGRP
ncbi:histidine kinase [Dactylosporangium sp. NPDC006015]|uniref:sensor histidine kinase n=1 Tax=Dactylosporangium sp. NPDC006015 TaxID=3154576 RepID=UPI0033AE2E8F